MKEGGGGDNLSVAWEYPGQSQQVIPLSYGRISPSGNIGANDGSRRLAAASASCNGQELSLSTICSNANCGSIVVPCGECYVVDDNFPAEVALTGPLDIRGKLRIPPNHKVKFNTPAVIVQGFLEMSDTNEVTPGNKSVEFILTGSSDVVFDLWDNNAEKCPSCQLGPRPFVIAGGQLTSDGYKDGCPAWTPLIGLDQPSNDPPDEIPDWSFFLSPSAPKETECSSTVIDEPFDLIDSPTGAGTIVNSYRGWSGGWGTVTSLTPEGTLLVENRTVWHDHGPQFDLKPSTRSCIKANKPYVFRAKVRLKRSDGTSSICGARDHSQRTVWNHCPNLRLWGRKQGDINDSVDKAWIYPDEAKPDGDWMQIDKVIFFRDSEVDIMSVFDILMVRVQEENVSIEIDDVYLGEPQNEANEHPVYAEITDPEVCTDLVIGDGTAEVAKGVFPFYNHNRNEFDSPTNVISKQVARSLTIDEEISNVDGQTNRFYRLSRRENGGSSLNFQIIPGCVTHGAHYIFSGKFRLHQEQDLTDAYAELRAWDPEAGEQRWVRITDDNIKLGGKNFGGAGGWKFGDADGWTTVEFSITFSEEVAKYSEYMFYLRTYNSVRTFEEVSQSWLYPVLDYDDLSFTRSHGAVQSVIVSKEVAGCWGEGSEILVTSHTTSSTDHQQVRTITGVNVLEDTVSLALDSAILYPSTMRTDSATASAVALLSRNIKLDVDAVAFTDNDPAMPQGGSLTVLATPNIVQKIGGIEITRFGQVKKAYRHPIHFHMSGDVDGSIVANNVIREAFYKCIVVQGTNNLLIADNIAYDTMGHCYTLQDGSESGNVFRGNMGANTMPIAAHLRLNGETDHDPATFLISNTLNSWEGNRAAGSVSHGFWFELRQFIRGLSADRLIALGQPNPNGALQRQDLSLFKDNIAHSNGINGLKIRNYVPESEQMIENLSLFRNTIGTQFSDSRNVVVAGLYASDNSKCTVDMDYTDSVSISDATIIGLSDTYRSQIASQNLWKYCNQDPRFNPPTVGIQYDHFVSNIAFFEPGHKLNNIAFSGFQNMGPACTRAAAINVDVGHQGDPYWSQFIELKTLSVADGTPIFDGCTAKAIGVDNVIMNDIDGNIGDGNSPGVLVSNNAALMQFQDGDCTVDEGFCHAYCQGACYRTIHYHTSIFGTEDVQLVLVDDADPARTISIEGKVKVDMHWIDDELVPNQYNNNIDSRTRIYSASLPEGKFTARFMRGTEHVWPTYARKVVEPAAECGGWEEGDIVLVAPELEEGDCRNFFKNHDVDGTGFEHWMHTSGGAIHQPGAGVGGSTAIASVSRSSWWHSIAQYVDSRCMQASNGLELEFKAWFRMEEKVGDEWLPYICDPDSNNYDQGCPRVKLYMKKYDGSQSDQDDNTDRDTEIRATRPVSATGDYSMMHGTFIVDEPMSTFDSFFITIGRTKHDARLFFDNVQLHALEPPGPVGRSDEPVTRTTDGGSSVINGDLEQDDSTVFWGANAAKILVEKMLDRNGTTETNALVAYDRGDRGSGPRQWLHPGDFVNSTRFDFSANFKIRDSVTKETLVCIPGQVNTKNECPIARLYADARNKGMGEEWAIIGSVSLPDENGWGVISGNFLPSEVVTNAERLLLYFEFAHETVDLVVDNVQITDESLDCSNLFVNSDFASGSYANWVRYGTPELSIVPGVSNAALKVSGRQEREWGAGQWFSKECLGAGDRYEVSAKIKMLDSAGSIWNCDPGLTKFEDLSCPLLTLKTHQVHQTYRDVAAVVGPADTDGWYETTGVFQLYKKDVDAQFLDRKSGVLVWFDQAPENIDIIIDDVFIVPLIQNIKPETNEG